MNKITKEIIENTTYKNLDPRVIDYLDKTISSLEQQNVKITDYTKLMLTMIVNELILYYKTLDIIYEEDTITSRDSYKRKAKAPEINIMQKCHSQVLDLLDKILASPTSNARVKKLTAATDKAEDAKELLNNLMG